jgi:hypothetical protein
MMGSKLIDQFVNNPESIAKKVIAVVGERFAIWAQHRALTNVHGGAVGFFNAGLLPLNQMEPVSSYVDCRSLALVHTSSPRSSHCINEKREYFETFSTDADV